MTARTFAQFMGAFGPDENWRPLAKRLRRYLDQAGFHGIAKYLASIQGYYLAPGLFGATNPAALEMARRFVLDNAGPNGGPECRLALCLAARAEFPAKDLGAHEQDLLPELSRLGLARINDAGQVVPGPAALVSLNGLYLFLDAALIFPLGRNHEIYLGADSLLLAYYLRDGSGGGRALDLCSGSGILGLGLARDFRRVVCTDLSPTARALIRLNAALNGLPFGTGDRTGDGIGGEIEIRDEHLQVTLLRDDDGQYDRIVCNPPFVAMPPDLTRPLYAAGPGPDGLDYLRALLDKAPAKLTPGGIAGFVADLPGDASGPGFLEELQDIASAQGITVDLFVDTRVPAAAQAAALSKYLLALHPEVGAETIGEKIGQMIFSDLRADFFYLSTMLLRTSSVPGVRVFNRFVVERL